MVRFWYFEESRELFPLTDCCKHSIISRNKHYAIIKKHCAYVYFVCVCQKKYFFLGERMGKVVLDRDKPTFSTC